MCGVAIPRTAEVGLAPVVDAPPLLLVHILSAIHPSVNPIDKFLIRYELFTSLWRVVMSESEED